MQEGFGEADLREMAKKCRLLADQLLDERAAASLRKMAQDYDEAADAAHERSLIDRQPPMPPVS
jgi:hypothetical protein